MHVQLDNSKCTSQCFENTDSAAEFIAQSLRQGWKPELPIYAVQCQYILNTTMWVGGGLQGGPGGPWHTQNFGWVGHSAFGRTNNWPVCSLIRAPYTVWSINSRKN